MPEQTVQVVSEERNERPFRLMAAGVVLAFVFFGMAHSRLTPFVSTGSLINAPDEYAHVGYVRALAEGRRVPVKDDPVFPTYQWHQPPLYYLGAATVWKLGLSGLRSFSILLGVISLWSIWSCMRLVAPRAYGAHVLAAAFGALLPMRQAVLSSVGNDAATECVFSLTLYVIVLIACGGASARRLAALTALLAAGLLTKASCALLLPVACVAVWRSSAAPKAWVRAAMAVGVAAAAVVLASPWYLRNARMYGEAVPLRAFHEEFAQTARAADWIGKQPVAVDFVTGDLVPGPTMTPIGYAQLVTAWTARTYFAAYTPPSRQAIGAPVFMPPTAYAVFGLLLLVGVASGLRRPRNAQILPQQFTAALTLALAGILVIASFAAFTATYFQAQGRYLYPALLPLSLLWGSGMDRVLPERYRMLSVFLIVFVLAALAAAFCFVYVGPAYAGVRP